MGGAARKQLSTSSSLVQQEGRFWEKEPADRTLDRRGLVLLYCTTAPGVTVPLQGAHLTARPVFYGAVPAAWVGAGLVRSKKAAAAAYRLTLTQGVTYGFTHGIKHTVGQPRPYVPHPLTPRAERHRGPTGGDAYLSFPSGHASLSAALVTSWGLSYPRGYVIAPGGLWATSVALSRVHLGVHYPSDVLSGAVLGVGVALLVHQLREAVTPSSLQTPSESHRLQAVPLVLRIRF